MIAPARSVESFNAPQTTPPAQTCGVVSAFPQFLTPSLLGLLQIATADKAAPAQTPDGGLFITQAEIADMGEAGVDEEAKGMPGNRQPESAASVLPWLPPTAIPAQTPQALDPAIKPRIDADVAACEPAALADSGVPTAGPVPFWPSTEPAAPEQHARPYDSLPMGERPSAGFEEDVVAARLHNAATPLEIVSCPGQSLSIGDVDGDGVANSNAPQSGAGPQCGEDKRPPFTQTDLEVLPDSPAAGQYAFPKDRTSPTDASARTNADPGQTAARSVEHGPASFGRAVAAPPRRSSRERDTIEPADGAPLRSAPSADSVTAAPAPTLPELDSAEATPTHRARAEAVGPRGTAALAASSSEGSRSASQNMADGAHQEGAPSAPQIARSRTEAAEPRVFAFGMRLTPSDVKAQTPAAQQTESQACTPQHAPAVPRPTPFAEIAEQKPEVKRDPLPDSKGEPVSPPEASVASPDVPDSAPPQEAASVEEGVRAIGIPERLTPDFRRGETRDSGTQAPVAAHRAIHLQIKDADPPASSSPLREIKLELGGGSERVSVKLSERQGHVDLTVHSRDAALAGELRRDLPSLAAQIEQTGFRAEATRAGSNQAGDSRDGERWSEARDGSAGQGGGRQHRNQNPDERKKEFKWLFPTLGE